MATRKPSQPDFNSGVVSAVLELTGTKKKGGESLISDPKLRKQFREIKKRAAAKKR